MSEKEAPWALLSTAPSSVSICPRDRPLPPGGLPWAGYGGWVGGEEGASLVLGGTPFRSWGAEPTCSFASIWLPQLEEEKAALLGRQRQVEQEASLAREEREWLEQLRLEQEVEQQGLEGSLRVAEQAREALEFQLPTLRRERCRLQEQLAQVGVCGGGSRREQVGGAFRLPAPCILS